MKEVEKKVEDTIEKNCDCDYGCKCGPDCKCGCKCNCKSSHISNTNCVYGLGVIGAAIFFISNTTTFWAGVLGFLKALVWPAFMVFEAFKILIK